MSNINIKSDMGGNPLNLIHMHSKNVFDNIILNSDLNGTIVVGVGSSNVWNFLSTWVMLQDNKSNQWYMYYPTTPVNSGYTDKSSIPSNNIGVRVLIEYRE